MTKLNEQTPPTIPPVSTAHLGMQLFTREQVAEREAQVRAETIEMCAQVVEDVGNEWRGTELSPPNVGLQCAGRIRAMGEKP
ncbi:hypothetical protein AA103196_0998 [Ameyamaea chiangmaiensis NBRC 103196]|uniref:Uncharacterized protein n=1 Tax=Ameyamaea chiangmaiensis TaxID=442969 RepID=A0A850P9L9_9PROT|nr:hypothetical protein [Ameyamaea chiangmaiensis]MBS4074624.1 hypothetical protein [Ameyamaea chiangmaiensis]NVN39379.1 hypothetical protein [Ameyamaea chiangmaiensis]GBQ64889.1 hypothetical protein AA103196_0998 [Ameyamaea chiangmaiensis NBRC 103196]